MLPAWVTALRAGLGLGFMFVVAAEFMGASEGLGYLLVDGQQLGKPDQILAAIVVFALLGKAADGLLVLATAPLLRWQDLSRAVRDRMLILDRLSKTYGDGTEALAGVSLRLAPGEIVAMVGGSDAARPR